MSRIIWDQIGERFFETGVDHGVLYPQKDGAYPTGTPWSGLTNVTFTPSGAEENAYYADNIKYLSIRGAEDFGMTIECYTYPDEWKQCNGESEPATGVVFGQQARNTFGFSCRTLIGNDTDNIDHGYKIHLVYGCSASPSEQSSATVNESVEPGTFSYEVSTIPIPVSTKDPEGNPIKPVAHIYIDSTKADKAKLQALEDILYGTEDAEARLPMPDEVLTLMGVSAAG